MYVFWYIFIALNWIIMMVNFFPNDVLLGRDIKTNLNNLSYFSKYNVTSCMGSWLWLEFYVLKRTASHLWWWRAHKSDLPSVGQRSNVDIALQGFWSGDVEEKHRHSGCWLPSDSHHWVQSTFLCVCCSYQRDAWYSKPSNELPKTVSEKSIKLSIFISNYTN